MARWASWGLYAMLAVALAPAQSNAQGPAPARIALVDFQVAIKADPGYAAAEAVFSKEMKGMQDEVEKLQRQFDSSMTEYQKQSVVLSPSAKQTRETQLRTMQQTLQQRAGEFQGKVQQREAELIGPIEKRVRSIVDGIRAERNIGIVFDVGPSTTGMVAFDPSLDITPIVLQRLKPGQ